ncbi:hypothetical protein DFH09DRAFT_1103394 [Mycena vulgaris]|nr:hypothetical protein DFH09DRAFT_1103394 [Mycena vulgaris]
MPPRCNLFNLLEIHRDLESAAQLTIYLFIHQPEHAAARDKSNTRKELNAFNSSYYLQHQLHKRRRVRKAKSFSGSRNPPPLKRLVACRRVGLLVDPDAELPEIAADVVPGYVYGLLGKRPGRAPSTTPLTVGISSMAILRMCLNHYVLGRVTAPPSLARAEYFRDFVPPRDRSLSRGSLFSFKDIAGDNDPAVLHRSRGLNVAYGVAVWGDRLLKVLHEIISIEEESKGGVLRESWFQFTLNIPVRAEENTFFDAWHTPLVLYVMAPSAGIHKYLTHTFKVADVVNYTATLQRADIPNNSIKTIKRVGMRSSFS